MATLSRPYPQPPGAPSVELARTGAPREGEGEATRRTRGGYGRHNALRLLILSTSRPRYEMIYRRCEFSDLGHGQFCSQQHPPDLQCQCLLTRSADQMFDRMMPASPPTTSSLCAMSLFAHQMFDRMLMRVDCRDKTRDVINKAVKKYDIREGTNRRTMTTWKGQRKAFEVNLVVCHFSRGVGLLQSSVEEWAVEIWQLHCCGFFAYALGDFVYLADVFKNSITSKACTAPISGFVLLLIMNTLLQKKKAVGHVAEKAHQTPLSAAATSVRRSV